MRFDVDAAATPATGAGSINSVSYSQWRSPTAHEFAPVFKTAPAIDEVCALSLAKGIISRQTPLVGAKPWPLLQLASQMPQEIHRAAARSGRADRQR
jgi:hypothetical protein